MSTFKNFVQCRVVSPITASDDSIGLYEVVPPYTLPPEDGGLLVLTDSPNKPSKLEVISYTSRNALGLYGVTRGLEGTTAQDWTGPVYCYQSLLAGEFKSLLDSKVDKVVGKQLSDTNFTQVEKTKLSEIAEKATKNRADSENADKVHNHTTEQVSGLDSALAGKVSNTDSRLTDSREWTATTVSQAEAEAGTATARKAWTAERVRQAASTTISAQKGIANGIASLDANAKIPLSQLSDSIIGQVEYMGLWAASTNTPTLPATPIQKGHYYVVNTAGTQFGHSFSVGDWIISNGASWDKVDNTDAVSSVNGRTGNVAGLAESNDARFTDSREWTASTISQAEAEAGTATARRAFTAQRVRQAINAWWNTIGTAFGKTLLGSADAGTARGNLGLGTAAARNVGTDSGNVMEVGAFGLGGRAPVYLDNIDNIHLTSTLGAGISTTGTLPVGFTSFDGWTVDTKVWADYAIRTQSLSRSGTYLFRSMESYVWGPWREVVHTGNILSPTGQSTQYPMTQKAVTDALNTKANQSALDAANNEIAALKTRVQNLENTLVTHLAVLQSWSIDGNGVLVTGRKLSVNDVYIHG